MLALYRSERQANAPGRAPPGAARAGRLRRAALRNHSLRFGGRSAESLGALPELRIVPWDSGR